MDEGKKVKDEYDQWHRNLYAHEEEGSVLSKIWYQKAIINIPDLNGMKVLEIGCGRGEFSNFLHMKYPKAHIHATDFSIGAVESCRSKYGEDSELKFVMEDATNLSFVDGYFDFIICCETLEHIPDVEKAVSEIHRVLRNGGGFFITTPSYFNAYSLVWLKCWFQRRPFESGQGIQPFEHFYTFIYIKRLLKKNRLKIMKAFSSHFQLMVFPRTDPAKLRVEEFKNDFWNSVFKPFGVHFFYSGHK